MARCSSPMPASTRDIRSSFRRRRTPSADTRRSTRLMTAVCRVTSSWAALSTSIETRLDFSKTLVSADARAVSETGDPVELAAMNFHAQRTHPAFTQKGVADDFVTNGLPREPGAPYADPCVDDQGKAVGAPRLYKAAAFQLDLKINKAGWHFPQSRILALWGDVNDTIAGRRAPEPLFFRANTNNCITFHHTNLVPAIYELDDFQVSTPTDIIGQHIHLVKFDVTSSDGSGNGWNYEDGTFAPRRRSSASSAINAAGGLRLPNGTRQTLDAQGAPVLRHARRQDNGAALVRRPDREQ